MPCVIDVLLTPADFNVFRQRDISNSVCVVFDVLRATSVMVTALANGADGIIPVEEISEALELRRQRPDVLLCGERDGLRIGRELTGGVEFDLGNSPREYTPERVRGKTIITTTTNGTRALRACAGARTVIAASFLNMNVAVDFVACQKPEHLTLVCAGSGDSVALEDVLAAGEFCELVIPKLPSTELCDSTEVAWRAYRHSHNDLPAIARSSRNAHRLLANPALSDDVEFCLRWNFFNMVPVLNKDGTFRKSVKKN